MTNLSYEKCLELKNAGFPQKEEGFYILADKRNKAKGYDSVYNPSLEELVDGCGDRLFSITKHADFWQTNFIDGMAGETAGKTLKEAVCNLYLKLHKK